MATLLTLAEQVIWLLEKGAKPVDSKLVRPVLAAEMRQIVHETIKGQIVAHTKAGDDKAYNHYIATFVNVDVSVDATTGDNYSVLPAMPMVLMRSKGVLEVRPYTGTFSKDVPMVPMDLGGLDLIRNLRTGTEVLRWQWCWRWIGDRIFFTEKNEQTLTEASITKVAIKMPVIDVTSVSDTETLPIPPELETQVLIRCIEMHGIEKAKDLITDHNPNIR